VISFGVILGELVRRVIGVPVGELLRTELLDPLGLRDTHLGLPRSALPRAVRIRGRGPAARVTGAFFNRAAVRTATVPAAGVSTTARDAARFYEMLRRGGELDGVRVLDAATIAEARRPSCADEVDRVIRAPIRWSQGFQLGSGRGPMGTLSGPETFGHNGSNTCLAWADPTRELAVAYLTNLLVSGHEGVRHQSAVSDAVRELVG
jgi:CubicO group peptidase (beta-lactamase class C family)